MVLNYLRPTTPGGRFPLYYYATSEVQGERKSEFYLSFSEPQPSLALYLLYNAKILKIFEITKFFCKYFHYQSQILCPIFHKAFQYFFHGFPKSVTKPSAKVCIGSGLHFHFSFFISVFLQKNVEKPLNNYDRSLGVSRDSVHLSSSVSYRTVKNIFGLDNNISSH